MWTLKVSNEDLGKVSIETPNWQKPKLWQKLQFWGWELCSLLRMWQHNPDLLLCNLEALASIGIPQSLPCLCILFFSSKNFGIPRAQSCTWRITPSYFSILISKRITKITKVQQAKPILRILSYQQSAL